MKNFLIRWNCYGLGRIDHAIDIWLKDLSVPDSDDAMGAHAPDMIASDSSINRLDLTSRHQLSFLNGSLNRLDRGININHHAFFKPFRCMTTQPNNL